MARSTGSARRSRSSRIRRTPDLKTRGPSVAAIAAIVGVAVLLTVEVARLTIASGYAEDRPELAARLAAGIPTTLASTAMAEVGAAAATGGAPGEETLRRLRLLAERAPLAPEPYLVEAALVQRSGDFARSEALLLQARDRNPRSHAARYLLADVWLRQEKVAPALGEMAILARLIPASSVQLVPALSEYARTPGARDELRHILELNPNLKQPLLTTLAADPDNADLILSLAGSDPASAKGRAPSWQPRLIGGFVQRGDFGRAYGLWRRFAGVGEGQAPLLFNGNFMPSPAPAPFNWTFASGAAGVAEPAGGRLRVIHYGRANAVLAEQMLLLPPGSYRFTAPAAGNAVEGALAWAISCVPRGESVMRLPVGQTPAASFAVPQSGCPAQRLQLVGQAQEAPKDSDVQIGPASIERTGA